jgi:hypothetical protein
VLRDELAENSDIEIVAKKEDGVSALGLNQMARSRTGFPGTGGGSTLSCFFAGRRLQTGTRCGRGIRAWS